uniref:Ig-like domain-containing protein n=1 Tax=Poecilia formosa TaxID=48698 RepID=A0A087XGJ8_POEFO
MTGSCVTVPCSFDVENNHEQNLNKNCKAIWKLENRNPITGDLTKKDCTTNFNNMQVLDTNNYFFRLECNNALKYNFKPPYVKIEVTDNFPSPTLTPSTLKIKEGESVSLTCSAPAPCLPHPPTLNWTPKLGDIQETLQENQDKTKFKTSVMNFTASHLHHEQNISCTAVYKKQGGGSDAALTTSLIPDVLYSPKNVTVSVSPSGSVLENSNVSLTCSSDANPAEQNYTWYEVKAAQEIVTGTGNTLNTTVSTDRDIFFCKAQNDVGEERSNLSHIDVLFPARILFSSKCMKTSNQVSCFCDTAGNPSPTTHWNLHGKPITQPSQMVITHDSLNNSYLRSIITIVEPQDRDLSTLQCFSSNSLGSASKGFCVRCLDNSKENESQILTPVLIGSTVTFLLIICALLVVVWFQKTHYKPKSVAATSGQHEANEQTKADNSQPSTGTDLSCNNPEKMSKSSADKSEDVVYARLKWRENTKVKEEDIYVNLELSDGSCLNEKKCENGGEHSVSKKEEIESMRAEDKIKNIRKESEVVYAQVKFQTKTPE